MGFFSKLKDKLFHKNVSNEVKDKYVSGLDKSRKNFVDKLGLNEVIIKTEFKNLHLATSAIIGSTKLFIQSEDDIDTLINNVCSKGGTTIAGLNKLYDNNFKEAIKECYDACVERSKELAKK